MTLHMQPTRIYMCTIVPKIVPLPVALVLEPVKKLAGLMTRLGLIYFAEEDKRER